MINIQRIERKDMPLKGMLTIFETKIDDPKMDREMKKVIDKQGDRQGHKTNVKAQMTDWKLHNESGFKQLTNIAIGIAKQVSLNKYNKDVNFFINDIWGMKYKSEDITIAHDHWPATWSFAYYLNAPKDAPGLFFPEMGEQGGERKLEKGLFVMFEGYIKHAVRKTKYKGYRYVVSGNLYEVKK